MMVEKVKTKETKEMENTGKEGAAKKPFRVKNISKHPRSLFFPSLPAGETIVVSEDLLKSETFMKRLNRNIAMGALVKV